MNIRTEHVYAVGMLITFVLAIVVGTAVSDALDVSGARQVLLVVAATW